MKKLFDVKSLVTLSCAGTFVYLSIVGRIGAEQFLNVFSIIIAFYFGYKKGKSAGSDQ